METEALAQMEVASFCAGVRHKRYSGQLEIASDQMAKINGNIKNQWQWQYQKGNGESKSILKILISKASICHGMKLSQKKL